jgi:hypothetical protein
MKKGANPAKVLRLFGLWRLSNKRQQLLIQ